MLGTVLDENTLLKYKLGINIQQVDEAMDGNIIGNGCLILKNDEYVEKAFEGRSDFDSVLATKLKKVPKAMFVNAKTLTTVVMLEAEEIEGGRYKNGAFDGTNVEHCFFPKLKAVGSCAFRECKIRSLNENNFPVLQTIGESGF